MCDLDFSKLPFSVAGSFFWNVHLQKGTFNIKGNCEVIATSGPHFSSFSNDAKGN